MPRLGRPALPPEEVRGALIGVRVRDDERELIRRVAEADGKSMSDWAREVLVREARRSAKARGKPASPSHETEKRDGRGRK